MNETGASEVEACEHIKSMMCTLWKKINKEAHNSSFSQSLIDTILGLVRIALCIYHHGDSYTFQDHEAKSGILSLVIQPIPFAC